MVENFKFKRNHLFAPSRPEKRQQLCTLQFHFTVSFTIITIFSKAPSPKNFHLICCSCLKRFTLFFSKCVFSFTRRLKLKRGSSEKNYFCECPNKKSTNKIIVIYFTFSDKS